ncbi:MAG: hypothetical protein J0L87_11585 [Bacteroidetes bacterium]|nr:hypothetical protein [Bacteroidota bacterium]
MNHGQTILFLWNELNEMPEQQSLERIRHFGISLDIFNGNYYELVHHLKTHNTPQVSLKLMSIEQRHLLHDYQRQITRFLHNYIASALSLTDHARNHYRELYSDNNLFPDYQDEINKRFVNNQLAVFIKDLRQYFQHYKMPGVSSRLVYKKDASDFVITLLLPTKEIAKFSGWNSLSKKFLAEQTDDIDLLVLINDYHHLIEDFYHWFINRQMEIHKDDIKKVEEHKDKIRALEISNFLKHFIHKPKTIDEFEEEIFRYFPDEELEEIKNSAKVADRIEKILRLLKQVYKIDKETENKIWASCFAGKKI